MDEERAAQIEVTEQTEISEQIEQKP